MRTHTFTSVLFLTLLLNSTGLQSLADTRIIQEKKLETAPLNPAFIAYMKEHTKAAVDDSEIVNYGVIPAPVSITDRLGTSRPAARATVSAPSSYDLRSLGRVTSVKDQNPWGTCWAFGTYASMESCLLPEENRDFSEKNLVNLDGFDLGYDDGGYGLQSMAYLLRWGGPVNESDDPYPSGSWSGSSSGLTVQKHVQSIQIIPGKLSPTDNAAIKDTIMNHGAVYVVFYYGAGYYNSTYYTYYYTGSFGGNHGVAIVGWDDNFDRTKFSPAAPADGAYIVKNSWGAAWGQDGYFYVSYYDTTFASGDMFCFLNAEPVGNYNTIYQYDPLGWIISLNAPWAAALYTATASEILEAVGFYTDGGTTSYSLYVYTGVSAGAPRSGTLACSMSGSISNSGFHTLRLTTPTEITTGERFSVVLYLGGTSSFPQAVEYAYTGLSSAATAGPGETYGSFDGTNFADLTTFDSTANFCLKAYAGNDYDGDGIPDWWEALYFGHCSNCLWYADDDLDGQNNLDEYIAGMCPTNPNSFFMITNSLPLAGSVHFVIEWPSVSGRVYSTLWTTNLMNSFQFLETGIEYPRNSATDTVHGAAESGFYQVEVEIQ